MRVLGRNRGLRGEIVGRGDHAAAAAVRIEGALPGVLALHGFANTPAEVRPVVDVAQKLGRRVVAPALPGHGARADDLQRVGWEDWVRAANAALDDALGGVAPGETESRGSKALPHATARPRTVVVGLSLGSVLALHLAATRPDDVAALVILSCAVWLPRPWPSSALFLLGKVYRPEWDLYTPKTGCDVRDPVAREKALSYDLNPLGAAIEVERGGRIVRKELGDVHCPVLVMHGAHDRVCPPENVQRLKRDLGATDIETAVLSRSGHIVTIDYDKDEVASRIESFIERIAPTGLRAPIGPTDPSKHP